MTTHDRLIADVIAAADNEIVGRIRLQKILYFLDRLGLEAGASLFHYHHYGPYSRVLDDALDRAKALHGVEEKFKARKDGASYSIFEMSPFNASARKNRRARSGKSSTTHRKNEGANLYSS